MTAHIKSVLRQSVHATGTLTIGLPGILVSDAERFFSPVQPVLKDIGDTLYVSYANPNGFDGDATICALADLLVQQSDQYAHLNVIGVSLGGMLLADPELTWPLNRAASSSKLRLAVLDSPSGGQDFAGGMNRLLAKLMRFASKGEWIERPGRALMSKLLVPPKAANLEQWVDGADYTFLGDDTTEENYVERTIAFAMSGMNAALKSSFRRYVQQLAWMSRFKLKNGALRGLDLTYISNDSKMNETVVQPQATDTWRQHTGANVKFVDGAHAAPAEWPETYRGLFDELLCRLARIAQKVWRVSQDERPAISVIMISSYQ